MTTPLALTAIAAPGAFLAFAVLASRQRSAKPTTTIRLGPPVSWFGVAVAAFAAGLVIARGPVETPLLGWADLGFSLRLDALSTLMLGMIALLAVVIVRYSSTYLDGDERHGAFLSWLAVSIAAVQVLVLTGNLVVLVAAWVATSLSLHRLLLFYPERPGAIVAARKKFVVARAGDAFLIAAAVMLWREFGTGNLGEIFASATATAAAGTGFGQLELAALCLGAAAILRSAQFPTHGWLVEVMETPTPVSALLHAGLLNAGPFLVIRFGFVMDGVSSANAMLIVVGGLTAVVASVSLLTQPAVKVALGYSSAAHMGFTLLVCGIGVYPAAMLHLVAHSFYKAHAFLASGSVVEAARADRVALPARSAAPLRLLASVTVASAIYAGLATIWGIDLVREPELLVIGAILVLGLTQLLAPTIDSTGPVSSIGMSAAMAFGVAVAFFTLESGAHALLGGAVPEISGRGWPIYSLVAIVLTAFVSVIVLQILEPGRPGNRRRRVWAVHFRNGLYANAVFDRVVGAMRHPAPPTTSTTR